MKILLTGGSGDLGQRLLPRLVESGYLPINFDITAPGAGEQVYLNGSLLEKEQISSALSGVEVVVHIAAWHGIHESRALKSHDDFWDLNVNGTHNLIQACLQNGVSKVIHISSSSVSKPVGAYGFTKRVAEEIMEYACKSHGLNIITLRPRAFIPPWNATVYNDFFEWAKRFMPGAVHIDDVVQSVLASISRLASSRKPEHTILSIDREPDYPQTELLNWDAEGPGSSFTKHYPEYEYLAKRYDLDTSVKPLSMDISLAKELLAYAPQYSLSSLLKELSRF